MNKYKISYMSHDGEIINTSIMAASLFAASYNFYKKTGIWTSNVWIA